MSTELRVGMGEPYGIYVTVASSDDFDPTEPTGCVFKVTKPEGGSVSWTGTLIDQSSMSVTALYTLANTGLDLDQDGVWRFWIQFTVAGEAPGPRTVVSSFPVLAADQL